MVKSNAKENLIVYTWFAALFVCACLCFYYYNDNLIVCIVPSINLITCFFFGSIFCEDKNANKLCIYVLGILTILLIGFGFYYKYAAWIYLYSIALDLWTVIQTLYIQKKKDDTEYAKMVDGITDWIMWKAYSDGSYFLDEKEYALISRVDIRKGIINTLEKYGEVKMVGYTSSATYTLNAEGKKCMDWFVKERMFMDCRHPYGKGVINRW